jgi:arylformamidase
VTVDPFHIPSHVPAFEALVANCEAASGTTRAKLPSRLNVPYGEGSDEKLDLFFPERAHGWSRPIHMFIHGGYWRAQSKDRYAFVADEVTAAGAIAAIIDYSLMPKARMETLVDQTRRAARWLSEHAATFGGDAEAISTSGHSAGGHLASYLIARAPREADGAPLVRSALLVSGLYDLGPLAKSFLQREVGFTDEEIASWSPVLGRPSAGVAVTLIAGGAETAPFHEQLTAYAGVLRTAGAQVTTATPAGEDHMTIVRSLGQAGTECAALLRETIEASRRPFDPL